MNKIAYFLKYNGITIITRLLISFFFGFLVILLNEINYYFKWLEKTFKPSLRYQRKTYNQIYK